MGRNSTGAVTIDELVSLSIANIKKRGLLDPYVWKVVVITWKTRDKEVASARITTHIDTDGSYLEIASNYGGAQIKQKITLESMPSNLGRGVVWYFRCPWTWKLCRKLYLINGSFYSRANLKGLLYEKQTWSHTQRGWDKELLLDEMYEEINSKHFKRYYNGINTHRYNKLIRKIEAIAQSLDPRLLPL